MQLDQHLVFVQCFTYNHEQYIEDALNGFAMQQTNFRYVVTVVDDASTDKNVSVITNWISNNCKENDDCRIEDTDYGKVIQAQARNNSNCVFYIILLKENHYHKKSKRPYYAQLEDAAKYVAICEGDDYWTDPLKLQKQVDILEADEMLMACCTSYSVVDNYSVIIKEKDDIEVVKENKQGRYNLRDFFRDDHHYPTLTVVYRNVHKDEIREKYAHTTNAFLGDWTLWICLLIYGDMYYLDEVTSAYRINPTSVTHTTNRVAWAKASRDICPKVADILPEEYADIAAYLRDTRWVWISLIYAYKAEKRYWGMIGSMIMAMLLCPISLFKAIKKSIKK